MQRSGGSAPSRDEATNQSPMSESPRQPAPGEASRAPAASRWLGPLHVAVLCGPPTGSRRPDTGRNPCLSELPGHLESHLGTSLCLTEASRWLTTGSYATKTRTCYSHNVSDFLAGTRTLLSGSPETPDVVVQRRDEASRDLSLSGHRGRKLDPEEILGLQVSHFHSRISPCILKMFRIHARRRASHSCGATPYAAPCGRARGQPRSPGTRWRINWSGFARTCARARVLVTPQRVRPC